MRFDPDYSSITSQWRCPEWFRDAKLGIFLHFGPQTYMGTDGWPARRMYEDGSATNEWVKRNYGENFFVKGGGYKDIIKDFQAKDFNQEKANELAHIFKKCGARYMVPVAVHHDNYDMWDSKYQPYWNAVNMTGKDMIGMWAAAAKEQDLRFGVSSHVARSYRWFQTSHRTIPRTDIYYDGKNRDISNLSHDSPEYMDEMKRRDLYGLDGDTDNDYYEAMCDKASPTWEQNFENRMIDLFDNYHPDLYYVDGGIPFQNAGLRVLAHLYTESQNWSDGRLEAVGLVKLDYQKNVGLLEFEGTTGEGIKEEPWQSDKSINEAWFWQRPEYEKPYHTAEEILPSFIDTVSCNGNLLLNVPLDPNGNLNAELNAILERLGESLEIIGEALFHTRPWTIYGEGPTFFNGEFKKAHPKDIRFTRNKENSILNIIALTWPGKVLTIKTLNSSRINLSTLYRIEMYGKLDFMGQREMLSLNYMQDEQGLHIRMPDKNPFPSISYAMRLTFQMDDGKKTNIPTLLCI